MMSDIMPAVGNQRRNGWKFFILAKQEHVRYVVNMKKTVIVSGIVSWARSNGVEITDGCMKDIHEGGVTYRKTIKFKSERDAILFKLRWF